MAESNNAFDDQTSAVYRPTPSPRSPPALPDKHNLQSERDVECRLGIVHRASVPSTPPSSPPPAIPRKPDTLTKTVTPAVAKDKAKDRVAKPEYVNVSVVKPDLYVNVQPGFSNPLADSSSCNKLPAVESFVIGDTEEIQLRSKVDEKSGYRKNQFDTATSARVSQFVNAMESATKKPEKPAPVNKPGKLVVPNELKDNISSVIRKHTMRPVPETEPDQQDVGIDVDMPAAIAKPPATSQDYKKLKLRPVTTLEKSEDITGMLYTKLFVLLILQSGTVNDMFLESDNTLFCKMLYNKTHVLVLYSYLPDRPEIVYSLLTRSHIIILFLCKTSDFIDHIFLVKAIYKDCY